jgi:hypothetical protein
MTPTQVAHIMALVDAAAPFVKLFQQADASRDQPMDGRSNIDAQIAVKDLRRLVYAADDARAAVEAALRDAPQPVYEPFCAIGYEPKPTDREKQAQPGFVMVPVEPTPEMRKAAADAWLDCASKLILNKAGAAVRAAILAAPPSAPTAVEPDELADALRWREFRTGKALTVKCKKATVMFGPNPEPDYPKALDAAIDAAIASKGTP